MIKDILHLKSPGGWINDPNGFIYYQGKYHLFYQYFPYADAWGTMHWGHAVSSDLVRWEHLGVALYPTKAYDRNGIFSGSALEKDGELYLYYSAVRYEEEIEENIHKAKDGRFETSQAMLVSKDGFRFDNVHGKRRIIPVIRDDAYGDAMNTRDPKVWKCGEEYHMILGSTCRDSKARVLFYKSRDARVWNYVNQWQSERYGDILECPDLFRVGGSYVFTGSPMHIMKDGALYPDQAVCAMADYEEDTCSLHLPDVYQFIDYGLDLYAPQTNTDRHGQRVMIAWMRMPLSVVEEKDREPWIGMMCLPRVIETEDGHICFRVHPEVEDYFGKELDSREQIDYQQPFRLWTTLKEGESLDIGGYLIEVKDGCLKTDRSRVFKGLKEYRLTCAAPAPGGRCSLDIFVDPHLIEIFINGGQSVLSNVVYDLKDTIDGHIDRIFTA